MADKKYYGGIALFLMQGNKTKKEKCIEERVIVEK
jgi:hypothetical protein